MEIKTAVIGSGWTWKTWSPPMMSDSTETPTAEQGSLLEDLGLGAVAFPALVTCGHWRYWELCLGRDGARRGLAGAEAALPALLCIFSK